MIHVSFVLVFLVAFVICHPSNLICDDPRLIEGGMMMHNYVVLNPYTSDSDIKFEASADQYEYGKAIKLTVSASSTSKFTKIPVFLAISVEFTGPNGGAMGQFHDLSEDLALVSGCSSTVYSKTDGGAFTGKTQMSWTPHNDGVLETTGNATFKLVWGNGPGGGDPLAHLFNLAEPYMYMKTISLWDPEKWNPTAPTPPPTPTPPPQACVQKTNNPGEHTFKNSPVFIEHLKEGTQTFATKRCIRCRLDQRHVCRSARVECPTRPGAPVVEHTWLKSDRCEGSPTRTVATPEGYITCPSPEHYSPFKVDLARFVPKLQRDFPDYFKNNKTVEEAIEEYRRMLTLVQKHPNQPVVPSKLVDLVWHSHILDTERYKRDSLRMFGYYLDHSPSFGGSDEKEELVEQQKAMFQLYESEFEEKVPNLWRSDGVAEFDNTEKVPDCCAALCVKPNCANCVGCNAVDCGHLSGEEIFSEEQKNKHIPMNPSRFAGYVATNNPQTIDPPPPLKCTVSPMDKMTISWTIHDGYIYFQHQFLGMAWYGVGLNNVTDMGLADFMVSFNSRNYTGVKDMYKYDVGKGYPCWDVLYECSKGNTTKGTKDIEDDKITRELGSTTSTWNRKLITADYKDRPITDTKITVLFAHGDDDYFNFHGRNKKVCTINFYSGLHTCN